MCVHLLDCRYNKKKSIGLQNHKSNNLLSLTIGAKIRFFVVYCREMIIITILFSLFIIRVIIIIVYSLLFYFDVNYLFIYHALLLINNIPLCIFKLNDLIKR